MTTDIRMYNCAFGDCFRITRRNTAGNFRQDLYVDFGIHKSCQKEPQGWKIQRYEAIINDMHPTNPANQQNHNVDFLLSHYHCDHYSGLDYLPLNRRFNNVYIPDVWSNEVDIRVVDLLLMRDAYTYGMLESGRSLISFLIKICHVSGRIYFVQRGRRIQNTSYTALAPSVNLINQNAARTLMHTGIGTENEFWGRIENIAQQLRGVVQTMHNTSNHEERQQLIPRLEELERQLAQITPDINTASTVRHKLSKFGNSINIIFHNHTPCSRNILFTGDAEGDSKDGAEQWALIEQNTDGRVPLHKKYHVIKIPHHGTTGHYHDFTGISAENAIYLIPNGRKSNWCIDQRYSQNANARNCSVYCSSNGACHAARHGCTCKHWNIVPEDPLPYQDLPAQPNP